MCAKSSINETNKKVSRSGIRVTSNEQNVMSYVKK